MLRKKGVQMGDKKQLATAGGGRELARSLVFPRRGVAGHADQHQIAGYSGSSDCVIGHVRYLRN